MTGRSWGRNAPTAVISFVAISLTWMSRHGGNAISNLTEAEWSFRITKDELTIRSIWYDLADRVKAHILGRSLAYAL